MSNEHLGEEGEEPETDLVIVLSRDTGGLRSSEVEFSHYASTGGGGFDTAEEALAFAQDRAALRRTVGRHGG
jgi:hypothetical protein